MQGAGLLPPAWQNKKQNKTKKKKPHYHPEILVEE
jgi:hypothetical protein